MEKTVPIKTTSDKFYRQYLEIINPLIKLRGREADVLSEFIKSYNALPDNLNEEDKWALLFSYESKQRIKNTLKFSDATLANNITALRRKNIIKDNKIVKPLLIKPSKQSIIKFQFNIEEL